MVNDNGLAEDERLVCIGQTALRGPDGTMLPAVKMYIKVKADAIDKETGMCEGEQKMVADIGGLFAEKMRDYITAGRITSTRRQRA